MLVLNRPIDNLSKYLMQDSTCLRILGGRNTSQNDNDSRSTDPPSDESGDAFVVRDKKRG